MLDYMLEQFSSLPVEPGLLRDGMKNYIDEQLLWCEDSKFSSNFPFRETGLPQEFFLQKIISCDGNEYLTGPRYRGGDLRKPFIDLVASSAPLTRRAIASILDVWQPMGAGSVRLLRLVSEDTRGRADQFFYVGDSMHEKKEDVINGHAVHLERASLQSVEWCLKALELAYAETYSRFPFLKDKVVPADEEDIRDAIGDGNLFIILSEKSRAGFIICENGRRAFISGMWITEEIVIPRFRGKHVAGSAQQALLSCLGNLPQPVSLWGTIESSNLPSIRAAEHTGRKRVMEYVFLSDGDIHD
ncbi:GNAT family protein [Dickeya poaceiphila]|uniref:GNAT family N-acetyltransferase n=1 Tax=Dickeya poaceiphila TaxID=568768 RepID=A0A5B8HQU7_9GAMM|nr:GNAT family N-acetyltransferase [Dickeya poaceiphila]QDX31415.1 GNAT family N-acetyltransferase [Dickeya poaceiphila]